MTHFEDIAYGKRLPATYVEIEVYLNDSDEHNYYLQLEEESAEISIKKRGVKVLRKNGMIAVLEMTEHKAISNSLI